MILNRFSKAILEQNWMTVVLEIVVVVVGIFIALQVDEWNQDRIDRRQELVYLAKLSDDLNAMRDELLNIIERRSERVRIMSSALYALETCDNSQQAQSDIKYALERYQASRGLNFLDATFNEMVASGALARIKDQDLKQSIAYTYSELGNMNSSMESFRISMPVVDAIVWKYVSYSVDENGRLVATFDIDAICGNIELRNAMAEMVDIQNDGLGIAIFVVPMIEDLLGRLENLLSRGELPG